MSKKDLSKQNLRNKIKGRAYQGEIATFLRDFFPGAHNTGVRQAKGQCDVENTPFWVECKRGKKPSITKAYQQAEKDVDRCEEKSPKDILIFTHHERLHSDGRSQRLVTMGLDLFKLMLYKATTDTWVALSTHLRNKYEVEIKLDFTNNKPTIFIKDPNNNLTILVESGEGKQ
jgi:hypothetical protein